MLFRSNPNIRQENLPDYLAAATEQNAVTYSVTNTLTARFDEKGDKKKYVEVLRWKLLQTYNIKEANRDVGTERRPLSDIGMELDLRPFPYLTFMARNAYNVYTTAWSQANYDLTVNDARGDSASITYRYTQNSIEESNLTLKAVVTRSLNLTFRLNRDHLNGRDVEKMVGFDYRRQCWTVGFDYGERNNDRTYAFRLKVFGL